MHLCKKQSLLDYPASLCGNAESVRQGSVEHKAWVRRGQSWNSQNTAANNHMNLVLGAYNHKTSFLGHCQRMTEKIGSEDVESDTMNVEDVREFDEGALHVFHVVNYAKTWRGRKKSEDFSENVIITRVWVSHQTRLTCKPGPDSTASDWLMGGAQYGSWLAWALELAQEEGGITEGLGVRDNSEG